MVYGSRLIYHKDPFGAVKSDERVTFRFTPGRELAISRVWLCVSFEFGGEYFEQRLTWHGLNDHGADDFFTALDTSRLIGPVWYWFRYERTDGSRGFYDYPGNLPFGEGETRDNADNPRAWQLTVTDSAGSEPPDWFGRGITYHIFPDRFNRSHIRESWEQIGDRKYHRHWEDCPEYRPDSNAEIKNNDFFGGDLAGVREKLPYIASLGTTTIYFSPVFESGSNHRYDTACYDRIDPLLGDENDFSELCREAEKHGIKIILDGVFNHTGFDSVYFNGRGTYPELGAYQSQDSEYYQWYRFNNWPGDYDSWWGFYTMPKVNCQNPSYRWYIYGGHDSIVRKWLRLGASGWRLDVVDELDGDFVTGIRDASRLEKPDSIVIGEVWEDASNKVAYGRRRSYLLGHELDSVMNYPLRSGIIEFILGGDAYGFLISMESLRENYPRLIYYSLMNFLGTHDTPRILTVFGSDGDDWTMNRAERAAAHLTPAKRNLAVTRLKLATAILFAFPGTPCVFYGDEAGMEGFEDPFNRRTYPWGNEDRELLDWYLKLGSARRCSEALQTGEIRYITTEGGILIFERICETERAVVCVNRTDGEYNTVIPWDGPSPADMLSGIVYRPRDGFLDIYLEPMSARLIIGIL